MDKIGWENCQRKLNTSGDYIIPINNVISGCVILKEKGYIGKEVIIGIKPEFIRKYSYSILSAKVEITEILGADSLIHLNKDDLIIVVRVNGVTT